MTSSRPERRTNSPARALEQDAVRPNAERPLSALLSQILVAYTVEFNNEFERQMGHAGHPGALLSVGVWTDTMRFISTDGTTVRELATQALAPAKAKLFELGCLERWGFLTLQPAPGDHRPVRRALHRLAHRELRAGWGSGRGIRPEWIVQATAKGKAAIGIWPSLFTEIEQRWKRRFGKEIVGELRNALHRVVDQFKTEFPDALPNLWQECLEFPPRRTKERYELPLPSLLSKMLTAFMIEFQRQSRVPLELCANTIRILNESPVRESELAARTGCSREASAIGWRLKPFVVVEPDHKARRGKVVRLSPLGLAVQAKYWRVVAEIEHAWAEKYGQENVHQIRENLLALFEKRRGDKLLLSEGLLPPEGVMRAGQEAPALGRRDVGAAARQRLLDLVDQTALFVRDPANSLPHYPMWDMNRGFGP